MTTKIRATKEEALIMLNAQKDYIKRGNTAIKCPRCGKFLEYKCGPTGESIYCLGEECIEVNTRGI